MPWCDSKKYGYRFIAVAIVAANGWTGVESGDGSFPRSPLQDRTVRRRPHSRRKSVSANTTGTPPIGGKRTGRFRDRR